MEQLESSKKEEPINGNNRPIEAIGQSKKSRSKPGLEGSLEQLTLFQSEIYKIEFTENDLEDLLPEEKNQTKWEKFVEKFKENILNFGIDVKSKKHLMRMILVAMAPAVYSHTIAVGGIFKENRSVSIVFFAYFGAVFFALLFEFIEHVVGKFKHRPTAHIASSIIGLSSYVLSMVGWQDLYAMESDVTIFGVGLPIGIKHILANILSLIPPLAVYVFTAQLYAVEQEEIKKKEDKRIADKLKGEEKKPYTRTQKYTRAQIENYLYELLENPNSTYTEFSYKYPDVGERSFDKFKATARKKLREHQTNKQKKK